MRSKLMAVLLIVSLLVPVLGVGTAYAQVPEGEDYTVQKDDNLWNLADKYLGNGAAYPAIITAAYQANAVDESYMVAYDPALIQVGWKLRSPTTELAEEYLAAPPPAPTLEKTLIEFWSTDNEEERVAVYEEVAARFMAEHPDIEVRIIPVEEGGISQRIATAVAANRLPDILRMGVERVAAFSADEILDEDAAEAVIASIGEDDFRAGPLAMVTNPATGKRAAVPYDGWVQAAWYRADMFGEAGLNPPTSWDDINAACDALPGKGNLLYALTLGTDPGQNYPHQVFEQVAMSNNAWPFDAAGNVTMNTPEMVEALRFYSGRALARTARLCGSRRDRCRSPWRTWRSRPALRRR
jgi:hypothetical protein